MNIELTDPSVENAATGCDGPALSVSERTYQALLDRIAARQIGRAKCWKSAAWPKN